jgi:hypothetical protein
MKHPLRMTLVAAALIAVAAVLVSAATAGSSSNGPPQTRIYGGGNVPINSCTDGATTFCTSYTREFSILAIHDPNEDVTYGTFTVGSVESGGVVFAVRVTCLAVSGNVAEVGGVIVQDAFDPSFVGGPLEVFLRDSGPPGTVSRDGISANYIDFPPTKPTCRDVSSDAFGNGYMSLAYGDIAIQNVTNQNG